MAKIQNLSVGDSITFGQYKQDSDSAEKSPIDWTVLDVRDTDDGKQALLLSDYGLNEKPYHEKLEPITWEHCTLRKWLNNEFLQAAFTPEEQSRIVLADVPADKNPDFDTDPGNPTKDKVFLLSISEMERYVENEYARCCTPTDYVQSVERFDWYSAFNSLVDYDRWGWLRSPGPNKDTAARVHLNGNCRGGRAVTSYYHLVRPALWLKLDS